MTESPQGWGSVTAVQQGLCPPYAYIAQSVSGQQWGLVAAGLIQYDVREVARLLSDCAQRSELDLKLDSRSPIVTQLGQFEFSAVDPSWVGPMGLGGSRAQSDVRWVQVAPVRPWRTVDTPDMGLDLSTAACWRWLRQPWDEPAPARSHLVATLDVLRGERPLTVFRWESDQWEALHVSAQDVDSSDVRVLPIGALCEVVDNWSRFLQLEVGAGLQLQDGDWVPA